MRSIASSILSAAKAQARKLTGHVVFKDNRLRFDEMSKLGSDSGLYGDVISHDADVDRGSIYRVANVNNMLAYMYISSPGGSWPGWTITSRNLKANSRPGVYQNRVFYQESGGAVVYANFSGGSLGGSNTFWAGAANSTYALAPVDEKNFAYHRAIDGTNYGVMGFWKVNESDNPNNGANIIFPGRVYGANQVNRVFDAEKIGSNRYIFWSDYEGKRVRVVNFDGYNWSDFTDLIPMDVVDDTSAFILGGTTTINGKVWVSGVYKRTDGADMQIYSYGPPWSAGRDIFIGTTGIEERNYGGDTVPVMGGKLLQVGSKIYYIGPGVAYVANGTELTGNSPNDTKTVVEANNFSLSTSPSNTGTLHFNMQADQVSGAIRTGAEMEWWVNVSEEGQSLSDILMGTFGVDAILGQKRTSDETKTIVCRSKSGKALADWAPDTSYDYWGPDVKIGNPVLMDKIVRTAGTWKDDGSSMLVMDKLNFQNSSIQGNTHVGTAYSTARPSRGGICQVRFKYDSASNFEPFIGIYANFYRESKAEAARRAGVPESEIGWMDYGDNGILISWSPTNHSGSPGIEVRRIEDGESLFYQVNTYSLSIPADTLYWLSVEFYEGHLRILYRADSSSTWSVLENGWAMETATVHNDENPWIREDQVGRFALVLDNNTPYTTFSNFNSTADIIPIGSPTGLPTGTYQVDEEQITISGFSAYKTMGGQKTVIDGYLFPNDGQTWNNSYKGPFTGYPIWVYYKDTGPEAHDYYNDLCLVVTEGPGKGQCFKVTDFDKDAPAQWISTGSYTPPDNWMNHVGDGSYGYWETSNGCRRIFVDRDPKGLVNDGSGVMVLPAAFVTTRGANSTVATSHSPINIGGYFERFNFYSAARVHVDQFSVFTDNHEWSIEEMITEIAAKAGVYNINSAKHLSGTKTISTSQSSMKSSYGVRQANVIARMKHVSGSGDFGIQFGVTDSDNGYVVAMDPSTQIHGGTNVSLYKNGSLQETYKIDAHGGNSWVKYSIVEDRVLVYVNERLSAGFVLDAEIDTQSWAHPICVGGNSVVEIDWPECSMRVDNFIMDMGVNGLNLMRTLIGQKRIYWQDDRDGNMRIYRNRTTVNSGDPYEMAFQGGNTGSEAELATRIRVEGADIRQAIDADALREHGSIFRVINAEDVMTAQDAAVEAEWLLNETKNMSDAYNVIGACDPRVEAGDIVYIKVPTNDDLDTLVSTKIIVDSINVNLGVGESHATFDMNIQGHVTD